MASLNLRSVTLNFPIYGVAARQFRTQIIKPLKLGRSSTDHNRLLVRALNTVSLSASAGDRIALIGGNGAGKSTLLKLMAGIYEPTSGVIERRGTIRTLLDMSSGMEEDTSGRDNIIIRARYMGASIKQAKAMVDEIVDFAELGEFIDLPIRTYSAGMRIRLAFSIATSFNADIMLIDEVLGAGDAAFIDKATARMENIIKNAGLVVLATHALALSDAVAQRGIFMKDGRVAFDGPYAEAVAAYMASTHAAA
ncbi:MAG TPA: ABC transporter ATP-binding protein [Caulobacter sp.]|nr:ABC transporter ATP-binding protein [Caulobacter sp.]